MATCLHGHQASISLAVSMVTNVIDNELRHTKLAMFMQKSGGEFLPAKETTMVSSSLDMMGAIRSALQLCCPLRASKVDVVLQSLVPMIAKYVSHVVGVRENGRMVLQEASANG